MDKKKFVSKILFSILILFNSIAYSEDIKKAWLGISVKPNINGNINLIISEIEKGSPAENVGLFKNDLLKSVNGEKLKNSLDFIRKFNAFKPGQKITLEIVRNKKTFKQEILLTTKNINSDTKEDIVRKEFTAGFSGIQAYRDVKNINYYKKSKLKKILDNDKNEYLIVSCIYQNSDADNKGIKLYDKIIEINEKTISKSQGLKSLKNNEIKVKIKRKDKILLKKIKTIRRGETKNYKLKCIDEHKEYECEEKVNIAADLRKYDYWDKIYKCLKQKKVNIIPVGSISYNLSWIKIISLEKLIKNYSFKKNRDLEKLNIYIPEALKVIDEMEKFLSSDIKKKTIAKQNYDKLIDSVSYAARYAQVEGVKGLDKYKFNLGGKSIDIIKADIESLILKKDFENKDLKKIKKSFSSLNKNNKKFIKKNWPLIIDKINWDNIFQYSSKYTPREETIKFFQIILDLGNLYNEENNFEKSIYYFELGEKKLENWKKSNKLNLYYVVYQRKLVSAAATPKFILYTSKYNANLNSPDKAKKYLNQIKSTILSLEKIEKLFFSLNKDLQKKIKKKYPTHLTTIYQNLSTGNMMYQDKFQAFKWTQKMMNEVNNYPKSRKNDADILSAHFNMILSSLGVNRLEIANYHINQFKNYSSKVVESVSGVKDVANYSSMLSPIILHAGLFYEAEQFINFTNNFFDYDYQILGNFQKDSILYTSGRINLLNKNYDKAIEDFEIASQTFFNNPGSADISLMYSAYSSLMLLEAYIMKNDLKKFEDLFYKLTNSYPKNYRTFNETKPSKYFFIPSDVAMSQVFSILKYLNLKNINITKKEAKELLSLMKKNFQNYSPGEESKILMIKYAAMISSNLYNIDKNRTLKFLNFLEKEIINEYSNAFFNSNLSPNHKIDDLISAFLNISYQSNDKKIFSENYKLIQIISNSLTSKDLRKSFNKKKFKEKKHQRLIYEYQKLQVAKNSIYISDDFSTFNENEIKELNSKSFKNFSRSSKIDKKILEIEEKIKKEIPEYFAKIKPKGASLKKIQSLLQKKQVFLEYFFLENHFYALVIKKNDHKLFKFKTNKNNLQNLSSSIKESLLVTDSGDLKKFDVNSAFLLYSKIFKPIENYLDNNNEIILAANDFLNYIPLHILPQDKSKNCYDCSKINWLKNKYSFTYVPNSQFFLFKKNKLLNLPKISQAKKSFYLGVGNPNLSKQKDDIKIQKSKKDVKKITSMLRGNNFVSQTSEITNLYENVLGSEEELKQIKQLLKPLKSDLLLGEKANEKNLKLKNLNEYQIIHFATHGELAGHFKGKNEPFLVLTPPDIGSEENDGLLTMSEIMNLENNAKLIILSACNTASNNIKEAEGFTGLARAFLYAGSSSVMVSNWYVETISAKDLTTNMIKFLKENKNISFSKALTLSMNKISTEKERSHPFYWAPFVIVGLGDNIKFN